MEFTLQAMSIFTHIVRMGSFTAAAKLLGISAGTASRSVRKLENHLGVTLLQRSTRCVRVTAEGAQYFEHCKRVLGEMEEIKAHLGGMREVARGRLSVDIDQEIAHTALPLIPEFRLAFPEVELRVDIGGDPAGLIEHAVDCSIVIGPLSDSSLRGRCIGDFNAVTVASPGYLSRRGVPHNLSDLECHDLIHYSPRRFGPARDFRYCVDGAEMSLKIPERISVNDVRSAIRYASEDVGIAQVCSRTVADDIAAGRLVSLFAEHRPAPLQIFALYVDQRHIPRSVRVFIDWLESQLHRQDAEMLAPLRPAVGESAALARYWGANGSRGQQANVPQSLSGHGASLSNLRNRKFVI
ncbi:LysR family transcriptional regulator [Burkholderia sp. Ac-20384]|uniref:LysR family transcriptional regulator n=1 Tax=Burkholderia sp. Ac-20384 TaxID=2703902 RepID=UPI00197F13A8|nr:LysR family transcriptional regulator [Burkholderia sp. Ac-20384]